MTDPLNRLSDAGVSIWLDDLSRVRLVDGSLGRLVHDRHVVGVTTNPTIFAKAITGSDIYADQIKQLAVRQVDVETALRELTATDVRAAADVLRPVFDATDGVDGRVSIEVDPRIARHTDRTIAEAKALWWLVDRPNVFIKIPAVQQGLPAIGACLAEGISINVTLIFSLARYADVVDAFLSGMERALERRLDLSRIASVASLFFPGWTPRSTSDWTRSAVTRPRSAARLRSPTPGWPTVTTNRPSRPIGGRPWNVRAPVRNGRCGRPPA